MSLASGLCWWGPGCSLEGGRSGEQGGDLGKMQAAESRSEGSEPRCTAGPRPLVDTEVCCPDPTVREDLLPRLCAPSG